MDSLHTEGFKILRSAIPSSTADQIKNILQDPLNTEYLIGMNKRRVVEACPANRAYSTFRYKDLYINSATVRSAVLAQQITDLLVDWFHESALAFQSLGFMRGSGLRIHRDSNYVDIQGLNGQFCGCWIALEDVEEGAGELIYYPGSHLLPPYNFYEDSTHWVVSRDGIYANQACHTWLENQMADHGIAPQKFLARKGDCIIWHGDLVHAGAPIQNPARTRYSLVTHFCSTASRPGYLRGAAPNQIIPFSDRCYFSSAHYDLTGVRNIAQLDREPVKPKLLAAAET